MNFKLWCCTNKAIPLVFDNSLSYLEQISKIFSVINNIKNDINTLQNKLNEINIEELTNLINQEFEIIKNELTTTLENFENQINQKINSNNLELEKEIEDFKNYINSKIKDDPTMCFDPTTGEYTNVCTIIQNLYAALQNRAMDCDTFDNTTYITVEYFDDFDITAQEFDISSTILLKN